jgi:hypothetical protein
MAAQYPNTTLEDDTLDLDYGGQPVSVFGQPAFKWLNSIVRFLGRAYLAYLRVPYGTQLVVSQSSAAAGDVAIFDAERSPTTVAYYVSKLDGGFVKPMCYGVFLEPCSSLAKARVVTAGIISQTIHGLAPQATSKDVALDSGTGRLKVAGVGDVVLGKLDVKGNVLFTGFGAEF